MAQDVTPQFFAGWDWIGGTPDRNTGLLGDVIVSVSSALLGALIIVYFTSIVVWM